MTLYSPHGVPYFIIGDDAFPLRPWMMKSFSMRQMELDQQIFNCRLSRARRVVENTFGILAMRFQIFLGSLNSTAVRAEQITQACVTLHNMLRTRNRNSQMNLIDRAMGTVHSPKASGAPAHSCLIGVTGVRRTLPH
ncbi:protein ALP1-like [Haliotis rubra]|uniref:protein ALP1-like n=1 Tax=Haliotis rubra TaxID=36100 RepID=UPI001EE54A68|nr:protein ALP1-like [Haliotis rubra]